MPKRVVEKFSFNGLKIESVRFFIQSPTKSFYISVFSVRGCLAGCLTFRPFLTLDLSNLVAYKKRVPLMIPPSSRFKAYLIYSLFRCEFEVVFAWIVKKLVFLVQILWILKLRFEDWPLWKVFYKRVHLLFKERHVSDC